MGVALSWQGAGCDQLSKRRSLSVGSSGSSGPGSGGSGPGSGPDSVPGDGSSGGSGPGSVGRVPGGVRGGGR